MWSSCELFAVAALHHSINSSMLCLAWRNSDVLSPVQNPPVVPPPMRIDTEPEVDVRAPLSVFCPVPADQAVVSSPLAMVIWAAGGDSDRSTARAGLALKDMDSGDWAVRNSNLSRSPRGGEGGGRIADLTCPSRYERWWWTTARRQQQQQQPPDGVVVVGGRMSADGVAAVVSGVDLALVSWMDGPVVDLSSISVGAGQSRREPPGHHHQRIGRCLCAKDGVAFVAAPNSNSSSATTTTTATTTTSKSVTVVTPSQQSGQHGDGSSSASSAATLPLLKPTLKKARPASTSYTSATPSSKTLSIDRRHHMVPHLVPQVVEVAGPVHRTTKAIQQTGQVSRTNSCSTEGGAGRTAAVAAIGNDKLNRSSLSVCSRTQQSQQPTVVVGESVPPATKPILSRKNWNNTIDASGSAARHQPSCLRRYGSQQSCKSATTLRSYVASTSSNSRGMHPSILIGSRRTRDHFMPAWAWVANEIRVTSLHAGGKNHHCGRSGAAGGDPSNANSGGGGGGGHHNNSEVGDDALSGLGGLNDDKISGGPGLNERELWSLHRAVPGLRRHDPRTSTIRQHYYPELYNKQQQRYGGWGWLVVGAAFLVQVLTTGLQLAFGVMAAQIARHFSRQDSSAAASSLHMEAGRSFFLKSSEPLTDLRADGRVGPTSPVKKKGPKRNIQIDLQQTGPSPGSMDLAIKDLFLGLSSCQIHVATEIGKRPLRKTLAVLTGQQRMAGPDMWIGVIQLSGSWLWTPLVVALCRRKSTRLTAVLGGLVLALAALFASFAQQLHQEMVGYYIIGLTPGFSKTLEDYRRRFQPNVKTARRNNTSSRVKTGK
ncbi:hypothetical protein DAPPUDRAFT_233248 [Daphnia pulex]|uniref:Uncharacterized protein n=1 Tax=Daphnia pulex TaxID=6669 RepID=E9FTL9_DAPPU|nr:hypothetical protein DAPPUDRAFT_233248 [Daphnia pulex]|eukprot:EFX89614.1 hypothetical protein DAPPUDRAFT_233248 [Daphnia pulex]